MSTIEATVPIMEDLPEKMRKELPISAKYKLQSSKPKNPQIQRTDEELAELLEHSDRQYREGRSVSMKETIIEARKQHGFI